jgi:hypothetical protein
LAHPQPHQNRELILKTSTARHILYPILIFCLAAAALADEKTAIQEVLDAWQNAHQNRAFQKYQTLYDLKFSTRGRNYKNWVQAKKAQFKHADTIMLELSKTKIDVKNDTASVFFLEQYQDAIVSIIGNKTLFFNSTSNGWKITSEKWQNLAGYLIFPNQYQNLANSDATYNNRLHIINIKFEITERARENVLIQFNQFYTPKAFVLEADRPRVVFDIKELSTWPWQGARDIPVNGQLINQIRTYFYPDTGKLRIVLDLIPSLNYVTDQTYFKKENIYRIQLKEADQ